MNSKELEALFDQQAAGYDQQWARQAPIRDCLHFLLESVLGELPENAHLLCVGAGTGQELLYLAARHPQWRFTAVEPSSAMMQECRRNTETQGVAERCHFHTGYLDSLPRETEFDAATSFLVSQFILDPRARIGFFKEIAARLKPDGILASSDLTARADPQQQARLMTLWAQVLSAEPVTPQVVARMEQAYHRDVAVLPADNVEAMIRQAGFTAPIPFFQAGMIRAWSARRD
tara:strand:- start:1668 stop:2363 length:696 start_codon:yes stop_codon:yes gene_type:complete